MKGRYKGPTDWTMRLDDGGHLEVGVSARLPGTLYMSLPGVVYNLTKAEVWQLVDVLREMGDMIE